MMTPSKTASIQPARFLGQHDWDAGTDGIRELGRARDQLLLLRIVFERPLGQRADKDFQELGIDAAGRALGGRGRHGCTPRLDPYSTSHAQWRRKVGRRAGAAAAARSPLWRKL